MTNVLSAIILSIAANLDNLLVGISYGAKNIKIQRRYIVMMGVIISLISFVILSFGVVALKYLPQIIANILGGGTLIVLGVIGLANGAKERTNTKKIKSMTWYEAIMIAFFLSLNNVLICFAAGIGGTSIPASICFSFIFSTLFLYLGNILGGKFSSINISKIVSALLIVLGIIEML